MWRNWKCTIFLIVSLGLMIDLCQAVKVASKRLCGISGRAKQSKRKTWLELDMEFLLAMIEKSGDQMPRITCPEEFISPKVPAYIKLGNFMRYNKELEKAIENKEIALPSLKYEDYEKVRRFIYERIYAGIVWAKKCMRPKPIVSNPKRPYTPSEATKERIKQEHEELQKLLEQWARENEKDVVDPDDRSPIQNINIPLSRIGIKIPPMMPRRDAGIEVMKAYESRWKDVIRMFTRKWNMWENKFDAPNSPLPKKVWNKLRRKLEDRYESWRWLKSISGLDLSDDEVDPNAIIDVEGD